MKPWRSKALLGVLFVLAAIIIVRLFYIQVVNSKYYKSQALGQQTGFSEVKGHRGEVFFTESKEAEGSASSGELKSFAINKDKWTVYAVPKNIIDHGAFAEAISENMDYSSEAVISKLQSSPSYVIFKKDVPEAEVVKLKNLKLEGLYFESSKARYYPQEALASQVIGFVGGGEGTGQYGIEGFYETILEGKTGIKENKNGFDLINAQNPESFLNGS